MAHRLRLIHWNKIEGEASATALESAGYEVEPGPFTGMPELRRLGENPPAVVVIDLRRAPSMGRDVAVALRGRRSTRPLPLVFIEGEQESTERIRSLLPDAVFAPWSRIRSAVKRAIAHPPSTPVTPSSNFAGYAGTPLPKKLGIRPGMKVLLAGGPEGFEKVLQPLPEGVSITRRSANPGLTLWFVRTKSDLEQGMQRMVPRSLKGGLWIIWPKKGSAIESDLNQAAVREAGLAAGLVDFKISAIDATWSGLRFTLRS